MKSLRLKCPVTFQKTADGNGESYGSEVFIMRSKDLLKLHEVDKPQEATWETLPKGDKGIWAFHHIVLTFIFVYIFIGLAFL